MKILVTFSRSLARAGAASAPALALALALALTIFAAAGCVPGLGSTSDQATKGSITGYARYSGQASSGGIIVSAESVSSGKTVRVRMLEGRPVSAAKAVAAQATTAASGKYTLSDLEAGSYTVYASSGDSLEKAVLTSVTVAAGKAVTAADLQLTPTGTISGTATLAGSPAQGILVYIVGTSYAAYTNASGEYALSSVPAGLVYNICAEKDRYDAAGTVPPLSAGGTATLDLTLTL